MITSCSNNLATTSGTELDGYADGTSAETECVAAESTATGSTSSGCMAVATISCSGAVCCTVDVAVAAAVVVAASTTRWKHVFDDNYVTIFIRIVVAVVGGVGVDVAAGGVGVDTVVCHVVGHIVSGIIHRDVGIGVVVGAVSVCIIISVTAAAVAAAAAAVTTAVVAIDAIRVDFDFPGHRFCKCLFFYLRQYKYILRKMNELFYWSMFNSIFAAFCFLMIA